MKRVNWGEWSTVNHHCYFTDYTGRPSICLAPFQALPQDTQTIPPLDICLSVCPTLSSVSLWPTNPFTHAVYPGELLSISTSLLVRFISMRAHRETLPRWERRKEGAGTEGFGSVRTIRVKEMGGGGALRGLCTSIRLLRKTALVEKEDFSCRNRPALIDLSAVVAWREGGQCDVAPLGHGEGGLLVIGLFLFRLWMSCAVRVMGLAVGVRRV